MSDVYARLAVTDERAGRAADGLLADPAYRAAVVDLLGVLAYGELGGLRAAGRRRRAGAHLGDKAELAGHGHRRVPALRGCASALVAIGADPEVAMAPSSCRLEASTLDGAGDWLEGLVKAYVGDGIARDFYREVARYLDPATRALVLEVLDRHRPRGVRGRPGAGRRSRPTRASPAGSRCGAGGSSARRSRRRSACAAERDALVDLLVGTASTRPGRRPRSSSARMFTRITEDHTRRMAALGLSA